MAVIFFPFIKNLHDKNEKADKKNQKAKNICINEMAG